MSEQKYGPWQIWNGGKCPVDEGVIGQAQLRNLSREEAEGCENTCLSCRSLNWSEVRYDMVTAYRVVIEPRERKAIGHVHIFGDAGLTIYHSNATGNTDGCRNFTLTVKGDDIAVAWSDE